MLPFCTRSGKRWYEQLPEPVAGDGEVVVSVHAASLKPIEKQLASGAHYASPRSFPSCAGQTELGTLATENGSFSVEFELHMVRWQSAQSRRVRSPSRCLKI
jgi:hypothetical protein